MIDNITLSTKSIDNSYITSNITSALNTITCESYDLEQRIKNLEEQLQQLNKNNSNSKYKIIMGK